MKLRFASGMGPLLVALALTSALTACSDDGGTDSPSDTTSATEADTATEAGASDNASEGGGAQEMVEVPLAALVPQTGPAAGFGEQVRQAYDLWVAAANEKSDETGVTYTIEYVDNQSTPQGATTAIRRVAGGDVPVVFSTLTSSTFAILPVSNEEEIVTVNGGVSPKLAEDAWWFGTQLGSQVVAKQIATYAREELDLTKAAAIFRGDDYGQGAGASFEEEWTSQGGEFVASAEVPVGTQDVQSLVSKVLAEDPDGVFIVDFGQAEAALLNEFERQGYEGVFLSDQSFDQPEILDLAAGVVNGRSHFVTSRWNPSDPPTEVTAAFVDAFEAEYGGQPGGNHADYYSAGEVIGTAIENLVAAGEEVTAPAIQGALLEIDTVETVYGMMTREGHLFVPPTAVRAIVDGEYQILEEID